MLPYAPMKPVSTLNIWRLTWPTILSNIIFMLMGIAYLKIAGEMGADAVAAVTTGQRVYWVLHAIMMGLCSSTTARRSLLGGRQQNLGWPLCHTVHTAIFY